MVPTLGTHAEMALCKKTCRSRSLLLVGAKVNRCEAAPLEIATTESIRGPLILPTWRITLEAPAWTRRLACAGLIAMARRRPNASPLGGQSVWGTCGERDARPVVMATAGMDAANLFQDASYGANEAAGSIVTLLAAADALSRVHDVLSSAPKQVAFALFQAENYGFVGSRRFVADIGGDFACSNSVPGDRNGGTALCLDPLRPSLAFAGLPLGSIDALLAVDQVALDPSAALVVHAGGDSAAANAVLAATDASTGKVTDTRHPSVTQDTTGQLHLPRSTQVLAATSTTLPPTPLTSFLSRRPGVSGAVISGYGAAFADPAYHSNYDTKIDAPAVVRAASLLARSLFRLAMDSEDASLVGFEVDTTLVTNLIACLTNQGLACAEVAPFVEDEAAAVSVQAGATLEVNWGSSPPSFYTSVLSPTAGQPLFVRDGLSYSRCRLRFRAVCALLLPALLCSVRVCQVYRGLEDF